MRWRRHFRAAAAASEPSPGALDRLRARAIRGRRLLRAVVEPVPMDAMGRLRTRLAGRGGRRAVRGWRTPALLVAAALVAVFVRAPAPRTLTFDERLAAETRTERALTDDVRLGIDGEGTLGGTDTAPRITWTAGTLDVDVTPDRGVDVIVETPESTVRVVGTRFRVTRDALGTTVVVDRGQVAARCVGAGGTRGAERELLAGDAVVCPPFRPAGLLARAIFRAERGDPAEEVLGDIDGALAIAEPGDPVRSELLALRIETLLRAGRPRAAAAAASAYLADPDAPRREEVEGLLRSLESP